MTFLKCISFRCCSVCCCGRRRFCGVPGYVCWLGFGSNGSNSPSRLLAVVLLVLGSRLVDMANDLVFFRGGQPSPRLSPTQRSGRNRWLATLDDRARTFREKEPELSTCGTAWDGHLSFAKRAIPGFPLSAVRGDRNACRLPPAPSALGIVSVLRALCRGLFLSLCPAARLSLPSPPTHLDQF